jgi:serine/threonine-protein kinase HipA
MLQLANLVGIETPEARLVKTAHIENLPPKLPARYDICLAAKRFDRLPNGQRIHIEDFAQVFDVLPDDKYTKNISYAYMAATIWKFLGEDSLKEFIRRIVFNLAICNTDMHLKNWSLIYKDTITPQLAPAYDLVATYPYVKHDELALKLGDTRIMNEVTLNTFKKLTLAAKLPEHIVIDTVNKTVAKIMSVWHEYNKELPMPTFVRDSIEEHLKKVPLFW